MPCLNQCRRPGYQQRLQTCYLHPFQRCSHRSVDCVGVAPDARWSDPPLCLSWRRHTTQEEAGLASSCVARAAFGGFPSIFTRKDSLLLPPLLPSSSSSLSSASSSCGWGEYCACFVWSQRTTIFISSKDLLLLPPRIKTASSSSSSSSSASGLSRR